MIVTPGYALARSYSIVPTVVCLMAETIRGKFMPVKIAGLDEIDRYNLARD